jgi:hypothetical protein
MAEDIPEYCGMLIQIDDHTRLDDLRAHYARSGFTAASVGGGMVEVTRSDAATEDQERRDVLLHLGVWEVVNPGATVTLVS